MNKKENVKIRRIKANVKGKEILFDEYYMIDPDTKEEIFDRNIEIENDIRLYDIYKKQSNLLTSLEIKDIRKKYNMNQKEFALAIGVGEITIHRFENGSIQTESVDSIIRLSEDPDIMINLFTKNKKNFKEEEYNKLLNQIQNLRLLKRHKIAIYNNNEFNNLNIKTEEIENVVNQLIIEYNNQVDKANKEYGIDNTWGIAEYITPLKLQKLLYYIQGLTLCIYKKPAFVEEIKAWKFGPVIEKIYKKYNGRNPISTPKTKYELSDGLKKIIKLIVLSYGQMESYKLVEFTHEEDPWINTDTSNTINTEIIMNYFNKVYND